MYARRVNVLRELKYSDIHLFFNLMAPVRVPRICTTSHTQVKEYSN